MPKIKVSIKLDIPAYKSHLPPLEVKFSTDYVQFLSKSSVITPFFTASTADKGAQVIILGHNYLESIGLNIVCLHKSHYTRSAPMIAKGVPGNVYKSTLDCVDGVRRMHF